ncbi:MAG TPA: rRNA adenine dimethyltransferase family protein [Anaerolineae bacterium]|nr:rRNA adenine dimethyltransferase family protein [Anaerolineae bacterium]
MSSASDVRDLLARFNLRPRKSLGQNFLVDDAALDRIVAAADLTPEDTVLEIGPGLGTLTRRLARAAGQVISVELDQNLIPVLRHTLAGYSNVELVHGDILELDPASLVGESLRGQTDHPTTRPRDHAATRPPDYPTTRPPDHPTTRLPDYKVVANLPYYITSAVIRHLLEAPARPSRLILTVQLEVAQRLIAGPGDMSLLAVGVQLYGAPTIVTRIKAGAFYPAPKVDSAVVRIEVHAQPPAEVRDVDYFFAVVRAGFGQKRKQLHNSLRIGLSLPAEVVEAALAKAGIDAKRRAETLTLDEWAALANALRVEM